MYTSTDCRSSWISKMWRDIHCNVSVGSSSDWYGRRTIPFSSRLRGWRWSVVIQSLRRYQPSLRIVRPVIRNDLCLWSSSCALRGQPLRQYSTTVATPNTAIGASSYNFVSTNEFLNTDIHTATENCSSSDDRCAGGPSFYCGSTIGPRKCVARRRILDFQDRHRRDFLTHPYSWYLRSMAGVRP